MGKETWKTVCKTHIAEESSRRQSVIDWRAERDNRPRSHTSSVHVSYRYSVNLQKKK